LNKTILVVLLSISIVSSTFSQSAFAQFQSGGVNKAGSWYVGEGLKKGDQFSYSVCHINYKDCTPLQFDFWVEGSQMVGSEDQWKLQVVVRDGAKVIPGTMNVGKVAPEPTASSKELAPYRAPFKSSIVWLSAYATADTGSLTGKGPKQFNMPSWGKIGNIGGEQIIPTSEEKIAVPDGIFDTVLISWKTGGKVNRVWIVDDFPFPVKADTYAHVAAGVPPQEYRFELLAYQQNVKTNPFAGVKPVGPGGSAGVNCPTNTDEFVSLSKGTNTNSMIVNVKYAPPKPKQGCDMSFIIDFKRKVNQEEFENEIHYDILVVDSVTQEIERSIADEEKRNALFTTSGQVRRDIPVKESGKTTYAILVKGTGPETSEPNPTKAGFVTFDVDVQAGTGTTTPPPPPPPVQTKIPSWIKDIAKFWAAGTIEDKEFVNAIQYLINQKIIKVPTTSTSGTGTSVIPSWIKNNAKWWSEGTIGDNDFVQGLQFLIKNGIIKIKS
jgi:hypothetical protein